MIPNEDEPSLARNDLMGGQGRRPVTERCRVDLAALALIDVEMAVATGLVRPLRQFFLELVQLLFQMILERGNVWLAAFSILAGGAIGKVEIFEGAHSRIQMRECLRHS